MSRKWLHDELEQLTSNDAPVWDSKAPIRARTASLEEAEIFRRAGKDDSTDDLPMVYLIALDRASTSGGAVAPEHFRCDADAPRSGNITA